jgi:hypothetical protein
MPGVGITGNAPRSPHKKLAPITQKSMIRGNPASTAATAAAALALNRARMSIAFRPFVNTQRTDSLIDHG